MKIIIKICIILFLILQINNYCFWWTINVSVTEPIPWLHCSENSDWDITCPVDSDFSSITTLLQVLVRWFSYLAMLWAVLFIIINWILYSMWWNKEEIKKRIIKTLMWIIVLMLSWVILYLVAPWVYE